MFKLGHVTLATPATTVYLRMSSSGLFLRISTRIVYFEDREIVMPAKRGIESSDGVATTSNRFTAPSWFETCTLAVVTTPASAVAARRKTNCHMKPPIARSTDVQTGLVMKT